MCSSDLSGRCQCHGLRGIPSFHVGGMMDHLDPLAAANQHFERWVKQQSPSDLKFSPLLQPTITMLKVSDEDIDRIARRVVEMLNGVTKT